MSVRRKLFEIGLHVLVIIWMIYGALLYWAVTARRALRGESNDFGPQRLTAGTVERSAVVHSKKA